MKMCLECEIDKEKNERCLDSCDNPIMEKRGMQNVHYDSCEKGDEPMGCCMEKDNVIEDSNPLIMNEEQDKRKNQKEEIHKIINHPTISNENYFTGLITSQNGIQGYWDKNDYTDFAFDKFALTALTGKIKAFLSSKKEMKDNDSLCQKIIHTFLVIYLIIEKESGRINETKLIIAKAKKFLDKNGCSYEEILNAIK